jgi:hypothetical protein
MLSQLSYAPELNLMEWENGLPSFIRQYKFSEFTEYLVKG